MTQDLSVLRAGCRWQRELCANNGSPTYVALIDGLLDRLGVDEVITGLLADDGQDPIRSALCLRLFGAVNRLAQATPNCGLTDFYPTYGGEVDLDRVVEEFFGFVTGNAAAVAAELPTPVQTNDVGRVVPLAAAMAYVTAVTGLPLRLLEVGASAGLNLLLDHYRVEADGASWGPVDSPLKLDGDFELGTPPADTPVIIERRGCDINPLDVRDQRTADLLRSFIWPEHVVRRRQLDAAIDVARSVPALAIDAADASAWVSVYAADRPVDVCTVVFHSIVLPYLSPDERLQFTRLIRRMGAATDERRPLAWVSMEPSDEDAGNVLLACELWPMGKRVVLATTTPHGFRVRWDPKEAPAVGGSRDVAPGRGFGGSA